MRIDPTGYAWWTNKYVKKRAARYGRNATKTYLSYQLRRKLKKAALKEATKAMILIGVVKLVDLLNNILNPGGWIFDIFLDKNRNGRID